MKKNFIDGLFSPWKYDGGEVADFIRSQISKAKQEERERIEKEIKELEKSVEQPQKHVVDYTTWYHEAIYDIKNIISNL